eukprot:765675-Hanusia_phi.AAC.2
MRWDGTGSAAVPSLPFPLVGSLHLPCFPSLLFLCVYSIAGTPPQSRKHVGMQALPADGIGRFGHVDGICRLVMLTAAPPPPHRCPRLQRTRTSRARPCCDGSRSCSPSRGPRARGSASAMQVRPHLSPSPPLTVSCSFCTSANMLNLQASQSDPQREVRAGEGGEEVGKRGGEEERRRAREQESRRGGGQQRRRGGEEERRRGGEEEGRRGGGQERRRGGEQERRRAGEEVGKRGGGQERRRGGEEEGSRAGEEERRRGGGQ